MPLIQDSAISLRAYDANGAPVSGALLAAYQAGTSTPVTIYSDEALSVIHSGIANAAGVFPSAYMPAGLYKFDITDPDTAASLPAYPIDNAAIGGGTAYDSVSDLIASTEGERGEGAPWNAGGYQYTEANSGATDFHVTTAAGVKLYVAGTDWSAEAFGILPDSDATGATGTDNGAAMIRMALAVAATPNVSLSFPPGYIKSSEVFAAESSGTMKTVAITGDGSVIVFTGDAATNKRFFSIRETSDAGANVSVEGLTLDLNRNPIRSGGSDMLSVSGFADVRIADNTIPSADNMGITVGRSSAAYPESISVTGNRIGGKAPVTGSTHDYGSIGDTGIWIVNYGNSISVTENHVRGTGDDAVAIAEADGTGESSAIVANNTVYGAQGSAYKSSATTTIFDANTAELIRNDMYRLIDLTEDGSTNYPQRDQIIGGSGKYIGTATLAQLGVDNGVAQDHPCGVHLQDCAGEVSINGLHLSHVHEEAIKITRSKRDMVDLSFAGNHFDHIGESGAGEQVIGIGGNASYTLSGIVFTGNTITNTNCRLLAWECSLTAGNEGSLNWSRNLIRDCNFGGHTTTIAFAGSGVERLEKIRITDDEWQNVTSPSVSLIDISDADHSNFVFWFFDNGNLTALPLGSVRLRNNQNPGAIGLGREMRNKRGCRETQPGTREFNNDNTLLTLDPANGWEVEAKAIGNTVSSFDDVYYRATWDPGQARVIHATSQLGGPSSNCGIELVEVTPSEAADQVFEGTEVLQLQGTQGWSDDPEIQFHVTWRMVEDNSRPVKVT